MERLLFVVIALFVMNFASAQSVDNVQNNTAERMLLSDQKLSIGGYGQIDYNQPLESGTYQNGTLDVHRLVLLFGYRFSDKTKFITEIELEHVVEVFVEQAWLNHEITDWLSFRGGLMLVPMGIVNEYHEPPSFNGVERPNLDKYLIPTTWREIGAGITGRISEASLKYQLYLMNGFNGYDGAAKLSGTNGLRKGRQKGIESSISSPNFTGKVDWYGIPGLKLGLSGYFGKSQSSLYDGLDKDDDFAVAQADSSVIGISMVGLDARYSIAGLQLRGQYNYSKHTNTDEYNAFTDSDLGSAMEGWYLEAGYNIFHSFSDIPSELVPFVRYEKYDTHRKVAGNLVRNKANDRTDITAGIGWKITPGSVLKADYQWRKTKADNDFSGQLNLGIGVWF